MAYPLPIAPGIVATIQAEFPMTESNWERMLELLEAFRPGLTCPDPPTPPTLGAAVTSTTADDTGLTGEAEQLITKVDEGGVPAFISSDMRRIASENGVTITDDMTPNEVIDALKALL
jgi:hypothetical protein